MSAQEYARHFGDVDGAADDSRKASTYILYGISDKRACLASFFRSSSKFARDHQNKTKVDEAKYLDLQLQYAEQQDLHEYELHRISVSNKVE